MCLLFFNSFLKTEFHCDYENYFNFNDTHIEELCPLLNLVQKFIEI